MTQPTSRTFHGTIHSESPEFKDTLPSPATLTLTQHEDVYEGHLTFEIMGHQIQFPFRVPRSDEDYFEGSAQDPRGWQTFFSAEVVGHRILGRFTQPHDHGTFDLQEVARGPGL